MKKATKILINFFYFADKEYTQQSHMQLTAEEEQKKSSRTQREARQ